MLSNILPSTAFGVPAASAKLSWPGPVCHASRPKSMSELHEEKLKREGKSKPRTPVIQKKSEPAVQKSEQATLPRAPVRLKVSSEPSLPSVPEDSVPLSQRLRRIKSTEISVKDATQQHTQQSATSRGSDAGQLHAAGSVVSTAATDKAGNPQPGPRQAVARVNQQQTSAASSRASRGHPDSQDKQEEEEEGEEEEEDAHVEGHGKQGEGVQATRQNQPCINTSKTASGRAAAAQLQSQSKQEEEEEEEEEEASEEEEEEEHLEGVQLTQQRQRGSNTPTASPEINPMVSKILQELGPSDLFAVDEKMEAVKAKALRVLNSSFLSSWELQKRLVERHEVEPEVAARVAAWLVERHLQSDADLCEVWVRSRWNQQRKAPSIIRRELLHKRVAPDLIEAAIKAFFGQEGKLRSRDLVESQRRLSASKEQGGVHDDEEELDKEQVVAAALLETARNKLQRMPDTTSKDAKRRRLAGWLQRRGHDWDVVGRILKLLQL